MEHKSEFLETNLFSRSFDLKRDSVEEESRTVEIAFSSEEPVERHFGAEILDHKPESIRLGRLNNSGPVLVNHDLSDQVGVIESARVDSDKTGRASIRFGRSDRASEIFQDVQDGIRTQISVGYAIHQMEQEKENPPVYRVTDFEPYEVSIVSSAADQTVGIARESEPVFRTEVLKFDTTPPKQVMEITETEAPSVDFKKIAEDVRKEERLRVQEIEAYGREHKETELAEEFIREGKSSGEFAMEVLKRIKERPEDIKNIGLTKKEINRFSFMRLLNAMAKPGDRKLQDEASYELDVCIETEKASKKAARGYIIPNDVLYEKNLQVPMNKTFQKRELLAGSGDGANLVPTNLDSASFIEFLDNQMVAVQMGATVLRNLDAIVKIPRRDAAITGGWIAESGDAGDVTPSYDQLTLQLKTYALRMDVSRQLRLQSGSLDLENLLRTDIASSIAVAFDGAAMTGTGSSNQPTGIFATSGIGSTTITANQLSWANAMAMQGDVMAANAYQGSLGYVLHPTLASDAKSRSRDSGSGRFVMEGNDIGGFRAMVTANSIYSSQERAIFANWNDLVLAYFSNGIDIQVNREFDDGRIRLVAFLDADVGIRHAGSFAITVDA